MDQVRPAMPRRAFFVYAMPSTLVVIPAKAGIARFTYDCQRSQLSLG
jgi:hypothetical protein